jgi:ribonuclease HII
MHLLQLYFSKNNHLEAGLDEAGRGCLAGPVTAAAVIFSLDFFKSNHNELAKMQLSILNDSKQLSEKVRFELRPFIEAISNANAFTHIYNEEIDEINILNASMKAMQESILQVGLKPDFILVDGNRPLNGKLGMFQKKGKIFTSNEIEYLKSIPSTSVIKGDSKYMSIAAASILAKTYRDDYMNEIHEEFPMYNWKKNKGYPTKEHREAIAKYGPCKYHRMSFKLLPDQLKLDL